MTIVLHSLEHGAFMPLGFGLPGIRSIVMHPVSRIITTAGQVEGEIDRTMRSDADKDINIMEPVSGEGKMS